MKEEPKISVGLEAAAAALEDTGSKQKRLLREAHAAAVDLLINKGLYAGIDATTEIGDLVQVILAEGQPVVFDTYCVGCRDKSTFRVQTERVGTKSISSRPGQIIIQPRTFAVQVVCQRAAHIYSYIFTKAADDVVKIGQFPSAADVSFGELRSIDKALDPIDRRELGTALGLFAHGTVLGAFVYLRRVFERMIWRAHERQTQAGHPIEGFATMRMDQRIAALKDELPVSVVQNSGVFSVLSIGIHELTEEQCGKHFPVLKSVLFQMLEQEEHKRKAAIAASETEAALQRILSDPKA
ncbi:MULTISPECIES: hypothetical protein [unclassified Sphingopyxis]|uniref:hypothetical protein n=1 Tax=unclassified Sphingopyxis TaxID=2614943 RepID=UPI0006F4F7F6|nr:MULTISPECIES: hypothetical protein [unclassified Sphingopyxis]